MIQLDQGRRIDNSAFHSQSNFYVESLLIKNTGTFDQQFIRPYATTPNLDNNTLVNLSSAIMEKAGNKNAIDGYAMSGLTTGIMTRSSNPESVAGIPNGWDTQRAQFIMKIVLKNSMGMSNPCFVTGYTDHAGINPGTHSIDPRMVFIVNSITQARTVEMRTPAGNVRAMSSIGTQQMFVNSDHNLNSGYGQQNVAQFVMRPDDIYRTIQNSAMYSSTDDPLNPNNIMDTTIRLDNRAKGGAKRLNTASNYLADFVNSYVNAPGDDNDQPIVQAMSYYKNTNSFEKHEIWRNDFFKALERHSSQQSHGAFGNSFTFAQLMAVDPNTWNNTTFIDTDSMSLHRAGQTNGWGGSDLSTVSATVLASSVPALMTEQLIGKIVFKSTNHTIDGQPRTDILSAGGFDTSIDMRQNFENFKKIFEIMVISEITFSNTVPYMLEMSLDLSGESKIKIQIGDDPYLEYVTPTFCDALFSPVVTTDLAGMIHTTNDLSNLLTYVSDAKMEHTQRNYNGMMI